MSALLTDEGGWDLPRSYRVAVRPRPEHIDGLNHTNNAVYVQWCEQVAWAHSQALGLDLCDYQAQDRAMAIAAADYQYLLPSGEGEALVLATWLTGSDGRLSMERRFQLRRESDGATLMRGRWQLVCIAISSGKPRRMPERFLALYGAAVVEAPPSPEDR